MSYSTWTTIPTNTSYTYNVGSANIPATTWATASITGGTNLTPNTLQVNGIAEFNDDAEFKGEVKIQGKSLKDSLDRIEERLAILRPNEELEEKWEKLRGLRKMYMELEAEIIEKEQIWATLKK